jgi:hypothetical protein
MRRHQIVGMSIAALTRQSWMRPSFVVFFAATLFLHLWGIDRNGWVDACYSAFVRKARGWRSGRLKSPSLL